MRVRITKIWRGYPVNSKLDVTRATYEENKEYMVPTLTANTSQVIIEEWSEEE